MSRATQAILATDPDFEGLLVDAKAGRLYNEILVERFKRLGVGFAFVNGLLATDVLASVGAIAAELNWTETMKWIHLITSLILALVTGLGTIWNPKKEELAHDQRRRDWIAFQSDLLLVSEIGPKKEREKRIRILRQKSLDLETRDGVRNRNLQELALERAHRSLGLEPPR